MRITTTRQICMSAAHCALASVTSAFLNHLQAGTILIYMSRSYGLATLDIICALYPALLPCVLCNVTASLTWQAPLSLLVLKIGSEQPLPTQTPNPHPSKACASAVSLTSSRLFRSWKTFVTCCGQFASTMMRHVPRNSYGV